MEASDVERTILELSEMNLPEVREEALSKEAYLT